MDSNNKSQVCPWCQTEIVWDPEIGPEDACPHCLNELSGYRTVKLKLKQSDGELALEDNDEDDRLSDLDEEDGDELDSLDLLDDYTVDPEPDAYSEKVIAVMDKQEYAPECTNCHELMLHAGVRTVGAAGFVSKVPKLLDEAFLTAPYELDVFVCPSCFKTDEYLTKERKEEMVKVFAPNKDL